MYPESLVSGFSRFGGFKGTVLGLLMLVINWINQRQLEKRLTKFLHKEKTKALQKSSGPEDMNNTGEIN